MPNAIFLDRDGVINRDNKHYTCHPQDFVFNEGIVDALRQLQQRGYLLIVVSNQAGIARGICTREEVERLHLYMVEQLRQHGVEITEIYYCPHHPEVSECLCRKPAPLLLEKALARFDIDPARSFLIGDRKRDMEAAYLAGIKGILVDENQNLNTILHLIP
jgi:D-glycero-D-manno-heptose 1,7-bisphosphate phosphatase